MNAIFGKKHVLLGVLLVALGAAVYLNYYFAANAPNVQGADTSSNSGMLGDAQYVGGTTTNGTPTDATTGNTGDYFVQARLNRENARQEALDMIKEMMNDVKATDEIKQQAADKAGLLATVIEQESRMESLIKAKGYQDCVVYIEDDSCFVVVRCADMQQQNAVEITQIVTAQSDIVPQNINLMAVK